MKIYATLFAFILIVVEAMSCSSGQYESRESQNQPNSIAQKLDSLGSEPAVNSVLSVAQADDEESEYLEEENDISTEDEEMTTNNSLPANGRNNTTPKSQEKEKSLASSIPQKVYELKENGIYVYRDAREERDYKPETHNRCWTVTKQNYRYVKLNEAKSLFQFKQPIIGLCNVEKSCFSELGKPSLFQLGYERHKEREIKPEDNRFGKDVTVPRIWTEKEDTEIGDLVADCMFASDFTSLTRTEFVNNGIVIIGKNISRVVIKKLPRRKAFVPNDLIPVNMKITRYGCPESKSKFHQEEYEAVTIANFMRVDFKENIFEFIKEESLPNNASYLSDEQLLRLREDVYQLIPRSIDKTLNPRKRNHYEPGYYIIEYYEGNQVYKYQGIKIIPSAGPKPSYAEPLKYCKPSAPDLGVTTNNKCALVFAEYNTEEEAEAFVNKESSMPLVVLPLRGTFYVARIFINKKMAETERSRLVRTGINKNQLKIIDL